jgi:hypothetical protein
MHKKHDKICNPGPTPLQLAGLKFQPRVVLELKLNFIVWLFQPRAEIVHELFEHAQYSDYLLQENRMVAMETVFVFTPRNQCWELHIAFQPQGWNYPCKFKPVNRDEFNPVVKALQCGAGLYWMVADYHNQITCLVFTKLFVNKV